MVTPVVKLMEEDVLLAVVSVLFVDSCLTIVDKISAGAKPISLSYT